MTYQTKILIFQIQESNEIVLKDILNFIFVYTRITFVHK